MKDAEQEICLSYKGVGKKFKNISALDDIYLEVHRGRYLDSSVLTEQARLR